MILTIFMAAAAGWAARQVEPQVTEQLYRWLGDQGMVAEQDRGVAALLVCLCAASALLSLLGEGDRTFLFVVVAGLAYFHAELRGALFDRKP